MAPDAPQAPIARVLVVDDEEDIRASLGSLLRLLGYQVDTAATGEQALQMIRETPYDVAVLDIRLPGIDGVAVMRAAVDIRPEMAAILLTGHASLESAIAAVQAGASNYLRKPASARDIASAIGAAISGRRRAPESATTDAGPFLEAGPLVLGS